MNRRTLMQQVNDLRRELDEALARAEAAEQELRDLRAVQHVLMQQAAPQMAFPRPVPFEMPATPIAEGGATA